MTVAEKVAAHVFQGAVLVSSTEENPLRFMQAPAVVVALLQTH